MSANPANRPGRPRDEGLQARRTEEILETATRMFAQRGYPDTDVESVAEAVQVGKGTIYRYFPSKKELFLAAVERGMRGLEKYVETGALAFADPLDRIENAILFFLRYFDEHPDLVELLIQERAHFRGNVKPSFFTFCEADEGEWEQLYQGLVDAGRVRVLPETEDQNVISDFLYGTILANYSIGRKTPCDVQARNINDVIFNGILTDHERAERAKKGRI